MTHYLLGYPPEDVHYEMAQHCIAANLGIFDFDEWCDIQAILGRRMPYEEVRLMNEHICEYNKARGTKWDWFWWEYPKNEATRALFEDIIAFGRELENSTKGGIRI